LARHPRPAMLAAMNTTPPPAERQFFFDWLRVLAFALLVPYHVGMYYVSWDWHVKSTPLHPGLEPFMMLTSPWRLGLLFLVAGAASRHLFQRTPGFVGQRSRRLLWPMLFGMLVVVPPQAYFEVVTKVAYAGSYLDFMQLYLQGDPGFCRDGHCLTLPTWNHLWFVIYLWVYSLIGWALWRRWPGTEMRFNAWLERHASGPHLLLGMALPLIAARAWVGIFPATHNLVWDWALHAQYLPLFLLGWAAARGPLWARMAQHRRVALTLAALSWCLVLTYHLQYAQTDPPDALRWAQRVLYGAMQWWCLVAVCGYAAHWLNRDHRWRAGLNRAVFCVYILHQTVIILLTRLLLPLHWPAALEGPVLIVATFMLCGAGYLAARRLPGLRLLLGIVPPPAARATPPQGAGWRVSRNWLRNT
jgi:glucans biosynthesis protein C